MKLDSLLPDIDSWLAKLKPRWMDLVGDYAGDEFFVVDGDSLCQMTLDDDLLLLGKPDKPGFQILHALYSLEQAILALKKRECNFEIVFFECNKYGTIWANGGKFEASSRLLAREIMKSHVRCMSEIATAVFNGLDDSGWHEYVRAKQPMFVFCHSGSEIDSADEMRQRAILLQRTFIRDVLRLRIAVSLSNEAKYVDTKILSFVYERQRLDSIKTGEPRAWDSAYDQALEVFKDRHGQLVAEAGSATLVRDRTTWLLESTLAFANTSRNDIDRALAFVFLASQLALPVLSIEQRAQSPPELDQTLRVYLVSDFYPRIFGNLACSIGGANFLPDLDGILFLVVLNHMIGLPSVSIEAIFGRDVSQRLDTAWKSKDLPHIRLDALLSKFQHMPHAKPPRIFGPDFEILPFSHPVMDRYLQSVAVHTSTAPETPTTRSRLDRLCDEPFSDDKHWHNARSILPKHLGGTDDDSRKRGLSSWERMKQLRKDQRFMTNLQRHAQTLTGAKGQPLERIVISEAGKTSAQARRNAEPAASKPAPKSGKSAKTKAPQLSSADKLKAKIAAEKQTKKASEDEIWWKGQLKELEAQNLDERIGQLENMMRSKRAEKGWLTIELVIYWIHSTLLAWIGHSQSEDLTVCERYTVRILRSIHTHREHPDLFPTAAKILAHVLSVLGFESFSPPVARTSEDRELAFKFVKLVKSKSGKSLYPHLKIQTSPTEFQLKAFGVYMDRSMDGAPDARVGFEPDGWQRQVLDNIDCNISTLVVAPTSAGKTFSSFYAMEKVLREDNEGVIVYVAPTKALCQQIAADVYARFSKNLKGKTVWAIHTRDFRVHDPLKAQILVTVPDVLSIMLLSPPIANIWTPRLKWIILDEIHSIGQLEGGQVWEHILLLSTCPILGLSATIGKPEAFSNWLGSVQKEHDQRYSLVEHKHRYSHLRKHLWQTPDTTVNRKKVFKGLGSPVPKGNQSVVLHPMSALLLGGRTIPPDLALESQDCLSLYTMLRRCISGDQLSDLAPETYFKDRTSDFLKQADVIQYEDALKGVVLAWMKDENVDRPDAPYQKLLSQLQGDYRDYGIAEGMQEARSPVVARENFIDLLHKLDAQGDLPCLAFDFDRSGCEKYARTMIKVLEQGEQEWRDSDPRWAEKLKQWELWNSNSKLRERNAQRANRQKKDDDDAREDGSVGWQSSFDPKEPAPEFSFANTKCGYSKEELRKDIATLRWQKTPEYLISALERGIAVHHAGMPKGYRSLVESLFRLGYCRVVISTGTLALGINAPARTVVFLEDSPYLTALMFRQCAGRAGRRGFDLLGNVVFYNFPLDRIHRLLLSRIPPLTGNWPLTTTLCLRLFNLLTGSGHAPSAVSAIDSFMRLPRLSVSSDQSREEVLHHIRFSIDFLRRSRLLSATGQTTALFGIVGHLYYEEPGNLAFAALVRSGAIHRMCSTFKTNQIDTELDIVLLVATLFGRRPLPRFASSDETLVKRRVKSASIIKLPFPPEYVREVLDEHNRETLQVFGAYAKTYAAQHLQDRPDNNLPLSNQEVGSVSGSVEGSLGTMLEKTRLKNKLARSSFVSNSGHDDRFASVPELCRSTRSGLQLNGHSIPVFDYSAPTNAYAYDYWKHEAVRPLCDENGIREGEVWFALQNFYLALATLTASLRVLLVDRSVQEETAEGNVSDEEEPEEDTKMEKVEPEDEEAPGKMGLVERPAGIPEEDWLVYEAFQSVTTTFYEKWEKMWA